MKKKLSYLMVVFLLVATSAIFADTAVVSVGVPIDVDSSAQTYTVVTKPDYYYYSGHRCYQEKRPDLGVNVLGLHAGVGGGTEIYCYPYP